MNIKDKADESGRDVHLTGDMAYSTYRLESEELTPADEITDEGEFPEYGDFAEVTIPTSGDRGDPELWAEVCGSLAQGLVELELAPGDAFRVGAVEKQDGEWSVEVSEASERDGEDS